MELQVTISLSDRLFALLEDKLPNLGRRVEKAVTKAVGAEMRKESAVAVAVSATPTEGESAPEPVVVYQKPREISDADLRDAMHKARLRIEGEGYDTGDTEGKKKYHKAMTSMFKQIATTLGAEKPTALRPESREAFVAQCAEICLDEDGNVSHPKAPF